MTGELRSLLLWTCLFLAFELPAHYGLVPWYTLSRTVWNGEAWWAPVGIVVAVFAFVLLGHLELHWSARWLVAVAAAGGAIVASHAIEKAVR